MNDQQIENLALFYRTMTTEQLQDYRAALTLDLEEARRRPTHAKHKAEFCASRIEVIDRVLGERGLTHEGSMNH